MRADRFFARRCAVLVSSFLIIGGGLVALSSSPASAAGVTVYAFAPGTTGVSCQSPSDNCDLQSALTAAEGVAGGTVYLETTGASAHYIGGFSFDTEGGEFLIEPISSGVLPVLDGTSSQNILELTDSVGGGSVTIAQLTLQDASATGQAGGAINVESDDTLTVNDSTFSDDSSEEGGAIAASNDDADASDGTFVSTLNVNNSYFLDNSAANEGGAISDGDGAASSDMNITDSSFSNNVVSNLSGGSDCGGALSIGENYSGGATAVITGSSFSNNTIGPSSASYGGGGAICSGSDNGTANLTISDSSFDNNETDIENGGTAVDDGGGGAISACAFKGAGCTTTISGSSFDGNTTNDDEDLGGGGAIANDTDGGTGSTLSVTTTSFSSNESNDGVVQGGGGAISNATNHGLTAGTGTLTVSDSSFVDNSSNNGEGGAILNAYSGSSGSTTISESTFVSNEADLGGAVFNGSALNGTKVNILRSTFDANSDSSNKTLFDATSAVTNIAGSYLSGTSYSCNVQGFTSYGFNAAQNGLGACGGPLASDIQGISAQLGALALNGGTTDSEMPSPQSLLVDAIPSGTTVVIGATSYPLCPPVGGDQEGVIVSSGESCNIGSVDSPNVVAAPPLNAPTSESVTGSYSSLGPSAGAITASWTLVPSATYYVCTLLYGFSSPSSFSETTTSTTCTFDDLDLATSYGIEVTAQNGVRSSTPIDGFASTPSAKPVVKTITCHRGKRILHRTGVSPRCPAGYKVGR